MNKLKAPQLTNKYKENGSVGLSEALFKSCWWFKIASFLWVSSILTFASGEVYAQNQIVPDNTLAEESSTVTPGVIKGIESDRIEGGAQRGANLFHSFENFNVDEGRGAYFTNPAGIENILSRVTGANPSEILGTLGVLGEANLFLINPNGVIFGPNASLDVGGSFIVTTANGIGLGETGLFSATEPETSNLLAINPSALFFNAVNRQTIVNQSGSLSDPVGLQVPTDRTLAVVGGDVILDEGNLTAEGGRIELGSVIEGEVSLSQQGNRWILGYDSVNQFGNMRIENGAVVNAGRRGSGDVNVQTARLDLLNGARITNRPQEEGEAGGDLTIKASEAIKLSGIAQTKDDILPGGLFAGSEDQGGNSGDIYISTQRLTVEDGAAISAASFNGRNGGKLTINASESIELKGYDIGKDPVNGRQELFVSNLATGTFGGEAGDLIINTKRLDIRDGALIVAVAANGQGGDLIINASKSIVLSGTTGLINLEGNENQVEVPSAVFADSIVIFSNNSDTQNQRNLEINTQTLLVEKGALISASNFGQAQAGNLTINASESIRINRASDNFRSGIYSQSFASGSGGNLTIDTGELILTNQARISLAADDVDEFGVTLDEIEAIFGVLLPDNVDQIKTFIRFITNLQGTGDAGSLDINAGFISIEAGELSASSEFGGGGNIDITAGDIRLDDSDIRTNVQGAGGGGNITLEADSIIAFDDSDIFASSRSGQGGNITLDTPVFFGESFRPDTSDFNPDFLDNDRVDVNASGATSGIITLPDVSFIQNSLTELPENPIDTTSLLATSCIVPGDRPQNSFTITGSGGLPTRPEDAFVSSFPIGTIQTIPPEGESEPNSNGSSEWQEGDAIVEPTGVYRLPNGQLILSRECS